LHYFNYYGLQKVEGIRPWYGAALLCLVIQFVIYDCLINILRQSHVSLTCYRSHSHVV